MEEQQMGELFWEIHGGNRGEGHGDFEPMKSAFDMLKDLPSNPRVLDTVYGRARRP
jgi:hypothetical protein